MVNIEEQGHRPTASTRTPFLASRGSRATVTDAPAPPPSTGTPTACEVTFVAVAGVAEERAVLDRAARTSGDAGPLHVPLVDQGRLIARVRRLWSTLGRSFSCVPFPDQGEPAVDGHPLDHALARGAGPAEAVPQPTFAPAPDILVATRSVTADLRHLAGSVAGRAVLDLGAPLAPQPIGSVLLLVALEDMGAPLVDACEQMAAAGWSVGLALLDGPVNSRYVILKTLLITEVPCPNGGRVLTSAYPPEDLEGAPVTLVSNTHTGRNTGTGSPTSSQEAPGSSPPEHRPCDVLIFCGHASTWDGFGGPDLILCARASADTAASGAEVLPCFHGGGCFRQERLGRDPSSTRGLTGTDTWGTKLLVLKGCHVARLAGSPDAIRHGLVHQAVTSTTLAVMASMALMHASPSNDALLLAMAASGQPLGDVVRQSNDTRRRGGAGRALGPLVLFGNPCLRLTDMAVEPLVAQVEHGRVRLSLPADAAKTDGLWGTLKLPIGRPTYITVTDRPAGTWVQGAATSEGQAYLWIRATEPPPERQSKPPATDIDRGELEMLLSREDPWEPWRASWRATCSALLHWAPLLEMLRLRAPAGASLRLLFDSVVTALPPMLDRLARAVVTLTPAESEVVDGTRRHAYCAAVTDQATSIASVLLACAGQAVDRWGIGAVMELEGREEVGPVTGPESRCACDQGRMWQQRFTIGRPGAARQRVEYHCEACGALDVDDGRRLVRIGRVPRIHAAGRPLPFVLSCTAPADEQVELGVVGFLQRWLAADDIPLPQPHTASVRPGRLLELPCSVEVGADIVPGLHHYVVITVANGALSVHRRPLVIERPDA